MSGNASRQKFPPGECATSGTVFVPGSFATAGTGQAASARGDGFTVLRTGVGLYQITFAEKYPGCVSFVASFEDTASGTLDDTMVSSEPYVVADGTVILRLVINSTVTETTGARINFFAVFNKYTANATTHA